MKAYIVKRIPGDDNYKKYFNYYEQAWVENEKNATRFNVTFNTWTRKEYTKILNDFQSKSIEDGFIYEREIIKED